MPESLLAYRRKQRESKFEKIKAVSEFVVVSSLWLEISAEYRLYTAKSAFYPQPFHLPAPRPRRSIALQLQTGNSGYENLCSEGKTGTGFK
jgi:hypothetical protein